MICIETTTFDKVILRKHLPYANNYLEIIFKGTDHVLVKIKLWVCLAVSLQQRNIPKNIIMIYLLMPANNSQLIIFDTKYGTIEGYHNEPES